MATKAERRLAAYMLHTLSDGLRSAVIQDGSVAEKFGFDVSRPIHIGGQTFSRDELFALFQKLADGQQQAEIVNDSVRAPISMDGDTAIVELDPIHYRFESAAMLASDPQARLDAFDRALLHDSVSAPEQSELRTMIGAPAFEGDHFIDVTSALAASPEAFTKKLRKTIQRPEVSVSDVVPDDIRHWDNITARLAGSKTLDDFAHNELNAEWRTRLSVDPTRGLASISLAFATPGLTPSDLLNALPEAALLDASRPFLGFSDPYAQIAVAQVLASRKTAACDTLAGELLEVLFSDIVRLQTTCQVFTTAFIIATARLAEHEVLTRKPAFWRRLAAHAHASLVVRASGRLKPPQDDLVRWAMRNCGTAFLMSIYRDFTDEPRWRPDWLDSRYLIADLYGRGAYMLSQRGADAPPDWQVHLGTAKAWVDAEGVSVAAQFPAIGEGARRAPPTLKALGGLAKAYEGFLSDPNVSDFVLLLPPIHIFGPPKEVASGALIVMRQLAAQKGDLNLAGAALQTASAVATELQDGELASAVFDAAISLMRRNDDTLSVSEVVGRTVEAAAALHNKPAADALLARRLEILAFMLTDAADLGRLLDHLVNLRNVSPDLAVQLGRAIQIAQLGAQRAA
jgi:hypothetical protein